MSVWTRFKTEERGISAVLISICLIAIFGAAMLSVDAGQLWTARRNAVTGTDAAALAQAGEFAQNALASGIAPSLGNCPAGGAWATALSRNVADTFDTQCTVTSITGKAGVVVVQTRKESRGRFAGVLGIGNSAAFSLSAAQWGYVIPIGLRPIALCISDPHIADAIAAVETHTSGLPAGDYFAPDGTTDMAGKTPGIVHHVVFEPTCNGAPGNWGWLDLDYYEGDQNFDNKSLADWVHDGYMGNHVALSPSDCDYETQPATEECNGKTGVVNAAEVNDAMCYLVYQNDDCTGAKDPLTVLIVLYDSGTETSGSNATFHMVALAHVKIWNYQLSGNDRYLDLQFVTTTTQGICCTDVQQGVVPLIGTRICGVDHDPQDPTLVGARCVSS